jgi:LysR family transcriptional activator of mexEF-oprN operon
MTRKPSPPDDLRRFDLNLLVAFDILITDRSVTAAARRMGIGQPAMSNALARLRDMFGDPLLIRTAAGMQPTGRALDLVEPVSRILAELRAEVFSGRTFSPETDKRTFRIGVSDQVEASLMKGVLEAVARDAPGVNIIARSVEMRLGADLLSAGAIDLAVGYFPEVDSELEVETLYHETFVCLFDAQACGVEPRLSLDSYIALPHILVSLRGEPFGHVDELLAKTGRRRIVLYTTPHFLAVPFLLHGLRAVAALPRRVAENCADAAGLSVCPLPLPSEGYDVRMAWHRRADADPAQVWLRASIAAVGRGGA